MTTPSSISTVKSGLGPWGTILVKYSPLPSLFLANFTSFYARMWLRDLSHPVPIDSSHRIPSATALWLPTVTPTLSTFPDPPLPLPPLPRLMKTTRLPSWLIIYKFGNLKGFSANAYRSGVRSGCHVNVTSVLM